LYHKRINSDICDFQLSAAWLDLLINDLQCLREFGKTIAVATVLPSQCRPIGHRDINHVREVQTA
jgi:hypothetical protein